MKPLIDGIKFSIFFPAVILMLIVVMASSCNIREARAENEGYSNEQIANAIYKAEGGAKTRHPYGILAHYKHTTPRQACLNTIAHARRDWNGKGDFLLFLQRRYCPIGASNDPKGLNKNWLKNVKYYLTKGTKYEGKI